MSERPRAAVAAGTVASFDAAVGLGSIVAADGIELAFHCVEIAGGTRTIDVGTPVEFAVRHKLGRAEAFSIRPAPRSTAAT